MTGTGTGAYPLPDVCSCGHHDKSHWPDNGAGRPCWDTAFGRCRCDNFGPEPTHPRGDYVAGGEQ